MNRHSNVGIIASLVRVQLQEDRAARHFQDNIIAVWLLQSRLHNFVCVSHRSLYSAPWLLRMITALSSQDIPIKGRRGK